MRDCSGSSAPLRSYVPGRSTPPGSSTFAPIRFSWASWRRKLPSASIPWRSAPRRLCLLVLRDRIRDRARDRPAARSRPGAHKTIQTLRALLLATAVAIALAAVVGPILLPLVYGPRATGNSVIPFLFLLPGALGFAALSVVGGALVGGRSSRPCLQRIPRRHRSSASALDLVLIPPLHATGAGRRGERGLHRWGIRCDHDFRRTYATPWRAFVPGRDDARSVVTLTGSSTWQRLRKART